MAELDETLGRWRRRSEAAGAVFEVGSRGQEADVAWDERAGGQFTPKGPMAADPLDLHSPAPGRKGKGKGQGRPGGSEADTEVGHMECSEEKASGSEELTEFAPQHGFSSGPLRPPLAAEAGRPGLDFSSVPLMPPMGHPEEDISPAGEARSTSKTPGMEPEPRDSEATMPAEFALTAPASPAESARGLLTASEAHAAPSAGAATSSQRTSATSDEHWGPTPEGTSVRLPAASASTREQPAMSSASYFRPYVRQPTETSKPGQAAPPVPVPASLDACTQPFPKAKEAVLQKKLQDASAKVREVCDAVTAAMSKPRMHPAEMQEILRFAGGVREGTRLGNAELENIGWPTKVLQQMKETQGILENCQRCEDEAKRAINEGRVPLTVVVKALEGILVAWGRLSEVRQGPIPVDAGMERRATSTMPLVSALLDQTMASVRRTPDVFIIRQLEALLRHSVAQPPLSELGVVPLFMQALHELNESGQGLPPTQGAANGMYLAAPEVVWQAVVEGDVATISKIIDQGGLVSGRTTDPKGHSILWDAIAFNNPEIALLLMRSFPPDMLCGVDLGELHPRNGNSLLHLASGLQVFSSAAEGLFAMLFERMPEALKLHRNSRGQTFLHIAAGRLHTLVMKLAAVRGMEELFSVEDGSGWTPRAIVTYRLSELKVASQLPPAPDMVRARWPEWCPLAALQPPVPGSRPPFADAVVEVHDTHRGMVELHTHCVILAGSSHVLHNALKSAIRKMRLHEGSAKRENPQGAPVRLPLDLATCSSLEVALFAIRFLYTGEVECSFRTDSQLLLQLVRLCREFQLPAPLRSWALSALLQCLDASSSGREAATLMCKARELGMEPQHQCFVARRLFSSDDAWQAVEEGQRSQTIEAALDALEPFIAGALGPAGNPVASGVHEGSLAHMPLGSSQLAQGAPLGSSGLLPQGPPMGSGAIGTSPLGSRMLGGGGMTPLGSGMLASGAMISAKALGSMQCGSALPVIQEAAMPVPQPVPSGSWW